MPTDHTQTPPLIDAKLDLLRSITATWLQDSTKHSYLFRDYLDTLRAERPIQSVPDIINRTSASQRMVLGLWQSHFF